MGTEKEIKQKLKNNNKYYVDNKYYVEKIRSVINKDFPELNNKNYFKHEFKQDDYRFSYLIEFNYGLLKNDNSKNDKILDVCVFF